MNLKKRAYLFALITSLSVSIVNTESSRSVEANTDVDTEKTLEVVNNMEQDNKLSSGNTIVKSKGNNNYHLITYENDVQVKGEKGWVPIDTTLISNQRGDYISKQTKLDVKFAGEMIGKEAFVEVGNDLNKMVKFSLHSIETKKGTMLLNDSEAIVKDNSILYPDIFEGVDLRHIVLNNEVKEDVILNKEIKDISSINYKIFTELKPELKETGEIIFLDDNNEKIYEMPAPNMTDSRMTEGSGFSPVSYDINYELTKHDNFYELKLIPSSEWLAGDRVYPIYIDPTLIKNVGLDTFVSSANPDQGHNQYWNSSLGQYVLRVGKYDTSTGTNYAFVKMYTLDSLKGANVTSANLSTYVNWSYYNTSKTGIWVDRVSSPWSENNVTWNTRPASVGIASTTVARNEWASFNVTPTVQEIVQGKRSDYGFKFHTNGNGMSHWKQLSAGENGKNTTNLSIAYNYPQMSSITVNSYPTSTNSSTGYANISWPSMYGADSYTLQMYDGKGWQTLFSGTSNSYTTKDKKIWPLTSQYSSRDSLTGGIKLRNGDGQELPLNPSSFYSSSSGFSSSMTTYSFRVIANYKLGSSPASTVKRTTLLNIIPETPETPNVLQVKATDTNNGWFEIDWNPVDGATSYDLMIFNGSSYERIPVGNETTWSSKDKRIFPTAQQLAEIPFGSSNVFRNDMSGQDFLLNPKPLYIKTGENYHNTSNYFVKVIAKSSKGESSPSPYTKLWLPTDKPALSGTINYSQNSDNNSAVELFWNPVEQSNGYIITMFNGKEYKILKSFDSTILGWNSSLNKVWPKELNSSEFVTDGLDLPLSPINLYKLLNGNSSDDRFKFKVHAFKSIDTAKNEKDYARYRGLSEGTEIEFDPLPVLTFGSDTNQTSNANLLPMKKPRVDLIPLNETDVEMKISWEKVTEALSYKIILFDGNKNTEISVPADQNSWSSINKKIFPTHEQLDRGEQGFKTDSSGTDLSIDPSYFYQKNGYSSGSFIENLSGSYFVRVAAVTTQGETPASPTEVTMNNFLDTTNDLGEILPLSDTTIENAKQNLIDKGFTSEDVSEMPNDLIVTIDSDGGLPVESDTSRVALTTTLENNQEVTIEGETVEEVYTQLETENQNVSQETPVMMSALSTKGNGTSWDASGGAWKGKSYITYIGSRYSEYRYFVYNVFEWRGRPSASYVTDQFGVHFDQGTKIYDNRKTGLKVLTEDGKTFNHTLGYESTTNLKMIKFLLNWRKVKTNISISKANGYGKMEIRYPHSLGGTTVGLAGYYYHPYVTPSGSVTVKNLSIDFPSMRGAKWVWDEYYTIKKR